MPIRGIGLPQVQRISLGFPVSSPEGDTFKPHIVIGNKQLQQMSLTGFTNLPLHLHQLENGYKNKRRTSSNLIVLLQK
jgi:hypothetical protein